MESESGAKIAIRGKGSVKEGKGRSDAAHTSNQEEDLHCLIMADTEDKVNKAKKLIHNVIETVSTSFLRDMYNELIHQAASIPEGQNELKRNQLRELAALNGTLRDDENQACQNCGEIGHRKYDCPQQRNFTANIICRVCGNAGHMARDCPDRQRGANWRNDDRGPPGQRRIGQGDAVDREYESLMQELSGGAPVAGGQQQRIEGGPGGYDNGDGGYGGGDNVKPWQRGPTGGPAPWAQNRGGGGGGGGDGGSGRTAPAPWASANQSQRGGQDNYGGYGQSQNYGAPPAAAAPWAQAAPGGQSYGGYDAYAQQAYGAPGQGPPGQSYGMPGMPPPPPGQPAYSPPPPPGDQPPPPVSLPVA